MFCPYFGYHTHIIYCVNLERRVQEKIVTQGIKTHKISIARARMLKQKKEKEMQQNKNEDWLTIIRTLQRKYIAISSERPQQSLCISEGFKH